MLSENSYNTIINKKSSPLKEISFSFIHNFYTRILFSVIKFKNNIDVHNS